MDVQTRRSTEGQVSLIILAVRFGTWRMCVCVFVGLEYCDMVPLGAVKHLQL